jgi:hypothetical protein
MNCHAAESEGLITKWAIAGDIHTGNALSNALIKRGMTPDPSAIRVAGRSCITTTVNALQLAVMSPA